MTLHSDHALRIVIAAAETYNGVVAEMPLEERGPPAPARITLTAKAAGATWSHDGAQLLELLVVRGQLRVNGADLGALSYVRLKPGAPTSFQTTEGCVLYMNERVPTEPEKKSFALRGEELAWRQGMVPGLTVTSLHQGLTKHTALVRWAPATHFNPHTHVGGEEILVLEGVFRDEHGSYPPGTWIRSPHLSNHRPFTGPEGATILVKVGHLDVPENAA